MIGKSCLNKVIKTQYNELIVIKRQRKIKISLNEICITLGTTQTHSLGVGPLAMTHPTCDVYEFRPCMWTDRQYYL